MNLDIKDLEDDIETNDYVETQEDIDDAVSEERFADFDDIEEIFSDLEMTEDGEIFDNDADNADDEEFRDLFDVDNEWDPTLTDDQRKLIDEMRENGEWDILPHELGPSSYSQSGRALSEEPLVIDMPYNPNASYTVEEFIEQAQDQEFGLNQLSVSAFLDNYESRKENGRSPEGTQMQHQYKEGVRECLIYDLMEQDANLTQEEAELRVANMLKGGAALHDPDQIAGGFSTEIHGYGSAGANSALGSLWGHDRAENLYEQIKEKSKGMSRDEMENAKLNIRLNIHPKS